MRSKLGVINVEVIPVARAARRQRRGARHEGNALVQRAARCSRRSRASRSSRTDGLKELRFPIQYVSRPDANFRGFAGTIASGEISVGDTVLALPSRKSSKVREITTADGPLEKAGAAQAVTVVLEDEIDLSRGDVLVHPDHRPTLARTFDAHLIWMGEAPLLPGKRYEFKIGHRYVKGLVDSIQHRIDVNDLTTREAEALDLNGLARVRIALEEPVAIDDYKLSRATGSFIIVDLLHFGTVGAGMVIAPHTHAVRASSDVVWQPTQASPRRSAPTRRTSGPPWCGSPGFRARASRRSPTRWNRRWCSAAITAICSTATTCATASTRTSTSPRPAATKTSAASARSRRCSSTPDCIVITAFISPFRADRNRIRERIGDAKFIEVYRVDVAGGVREAAIRRACTSRRARARSANFTGIDSPYEPPINPQLTIDTSKVAMGAAVDQILRYLENKGFLHQADPGL